MNTTLRQYSNLLLRFLRPQAGKVAGLGLLLLAVVGMQLLVPQILRSFIDSARGGAPSSALLNTALLFLGVVLGRHMLTVVVAYLSEAVGWNATNALRLDLAAHCLRLDMGFHNDHSPGEMIERVDGDVQVLAEFFSQLVFVVISNLLLLAGVLGVLFVEDWRVGLAFTAFTAVAFVTLHQIRDLATPHWQAVRQSSAELFGFIEERLAGTVDIRANGGVAYSMRRLYGNLQNYYQTSLRAWLKSATMINTMLALFIIGSALALGLSAYLSSAGAITVGTVYLIYAYTLILLQPLERLTKTLDKLQSAGGSIVRIEELYAERSAIDDSGGGALPAGPLSVEFEGVSFRYEETASVIDNLSFTLAPGQTLGLLGRTGSGKTSITRLLLRLYDPRGGTIRLGGQDIRAVPLAVLRERVGIVTQDASLFDASVRENLTFFDPSIPDERIKAVIAELGLDPWFATLADGLDTRLEAGGGLSAGQSQLLSFARVFLKDPGLIILDEASSRLDPETERLIERAVRRLLQGRTAIIIAHRLATVEQVDEIMILQRGAIAEHGARAGLAGDPSSLFARLLQTGLEETLA